MDVFDMAKIANVSKSTVRRHICSGLIKAIKTDQKWEIEHNYGLRIAPLLRLRTQIINSMKNTKYEA